MMISFRWKWSAFAGWEELLWLYETRDKIYNRTRFQQIKGEKTVPLQ
jgi:hypothetical protein